MFGVNNEFWELLDQIVIDSEIVIDRQKNTSHPQFPELIYPVDYGFLRHTTSMDNGGIDVWRGSSESNHIMGIMCTIDIKKRDSEIKILLSCTEEEITSIYQLHNETELMKGIFIRREKRTD